MKRIVKTLEGRYQKESKKSINDITLSAKKVIKNTVKVRVLLKPDLTKYPVPTWVLIHKSKLKDKQFKLRMHIQNQ